MSVENIKVYVVLEYHTAMKKIKALPLATCHSVEGPGASERPRSKGHTESVQGRDPETGTKTANLDGSWGGSHV